jgi:hypothetical protein
MRTYRPWIEILLIVTGIACALALLLATLGIAAGATANEGDGARGTEAREERSSTTGHVYEGVLTCSRCGARHSAALAKTAADCARICVRDGASFVLVDGDATYLLDGDMSVLSRLAGQRARVVGELDGKTIRISSVTSDI